VQLRSVPPPEMVANLRADNIDGFLAPDNIAQRAVYDGVGFIQCCPIGFADIAFSVDSNDLGLGALSHELGNTLGVAIARMVNNDGLTHAVLLLRGGLKNYS
jgi:hypothetical protein